MRRIPHEFLNGVELKRCTKCKQWQSLDSFHKWKRNLDGLDSKCKQCKINHRINNREKYNAAATRYRERHPERIIEYVHTHKQTYVNYRNAHRQEISKLKLVYHHHKYKSNIQYKLLCLLRGRLKVALKRNGNRKQGTAKELLGCSIDVFRLYLESLFDENMTWENYGSYWEIDHIIPCRAFDLSKEQEQKKCFHYTNLQPLEKHENRSKNDKLSSGIRARHV